MQPIGRPLRILKFAIDFFALVVKGFCPVIAASSFDKGGNYSFGLNEQVIFAEVDVDKVMKTHGMDITIVTNAKSKEEAFTLLKLFGMPFKKDKQV